MDVKYRNDQGECLYCGSSEAQRHHSECPIHRASEDHHYIVHEVFFETQQQLDKWGVQNHPQGTSSNFALKANQARDTCDGKFKRGEGTWKHVLEEEFWEAMAEEDPDRIREELIQVAAVAVSAIASLDRNERAAKQEVS